MFKSFNRKEVLALVDTFIQRKYGSYKDIVSLSMRDLAEIGIAIKSKDQEEQLSEVFGN